MQTYLHEIAEIITQYLFGGTASIPICSMVPVYLPTFPQQIYKSPSFAGKFTLWSFNMAIENGPLRVDLPIKDGSCA